MVLIAFTGYKGSGKTTASKYLITVQDYEKLSFASPLKNICKEVFGFTEEQLYGSEKETVDPFWNIEPRKVLQIVGTELFRKELGRHIPNIGEDIWTKCLQKKIMNNPNAHFVIDDLRFPNEAELIRSLGGKIIRIHRPGTVCDGHDSEKYVDHIQSDLDIMNNGTETELHEKIIKELL